MKPVPTGPPPVTAADGTAAAAAARSEGTQRLQAAWVSFQGEFEVQQRIWESLDSASAGAAGLNKSPIAEAAAEIAGPKAKRAAVISTVQNAIQTSSISTLKSVDSSLLNRSSLAALQHVLKAERMRELCHRLAETLETACGNPKPIDVQAKELEALIQACSLSAPVQSKARRVLQLPPTKEEAAENARKAKEAAAAAKAAEQAAEQAKIRYVAKCANTSVERATRAMRDAGGDRDKALIMLVSEEEALQAKKAADLVKKQQDAAQHRLMEAITLAAHLSSLADSAAVAAWTDLQTEFEVQMGIWDSLAAARQQAPRYHRIQQEMEGVMNLAYQDPDQAVLLLEMVLHNAVHGARLTLSSGMLIKADGVLSAKGQSEYRQTLAHQLENTAQCLEAGVRVEPANEKELNATIKSCAIDDSLAARIRQVLAPGRQRSM